jgi:ABC-type branched-subunit amino acid transport system substrate-binding protein
MTTASESAGPIKVGVITDQSGPLSFMGIANANVARMVIDEINANGGLLGRQLELYLEDSETTDSVGAEKATKLIQQDQVDVIFGGIYSSMREAIKGPAVVDGKKLYIYPEQYEGQECDPLIFCTGPVPAQQVEPLIPWLMEKTGAKSFYLPSADYIWPHTLNRKVREVVTANGGAIVGEEYFPLDHTDYRATIDKITSSGAEVVFNTIVPPGLTPFLELLYESGFTRRVALSCARTSTRTSSTLCRPPMWKVCTAASTTTRTSTIHSAPNSSAGTTPCIQEMPSSPRAARVQACSGA